MNKTALSGIDSQYIDPESSNTNRIFGSTGEGRNNGLCETSIVALADMPDAIVRAAVTTTSVRFTETDCMANIAKLLLNS